MTFLAAYNEARYGDFPKVGTLENKTGAGPKTLQDSPELLTGKYYQ